MIDTTLNLSNIMTNIEYLLAEKEDIQKLKQLWLLCFDEKEEAVDVFFENCFSASYSYCAKSEKQIVSALFLLPCSIENKKSHYVFAAQTHPDFRNKGIMGQLIKFALNDAYRRGDIFSCLFPANEKLYSYYEHLGYQANCSANKFSFTRKELESISQNKSENFSEFDFVKAQNECFNIEPVIQNKDFFDFAKKYYGVYEVKSLKGKSSFLLYEDGKIANVIYSMFQNNNFSEVAKLLIENSNAQKFYFTCGYEIKNSHNFEKINYGMIKSLDTKHKNISDVYIGINLG